MADTWAQEMANQFKNLPRASAEQFELPPRDRIVPQDQKPGQPAELSLEDAERLREKRARKAAQHDQEAGRRSGANKGASNRSSASISGNSDPWAKWKK